MSAAALPAKHASGGSPATGRDAQSIAFLSTPLIELLYSGALIRRPWWASIRSFSLRAFAGRPSLSSKSPS